MYSSSFIYDNMFTMKSGLGIHTSNSYSNIRGPSLLVRIWNYFPFFSKPKLNIIYEPEIYPKIYSPVKDFKGYDTNTSIGSPGVVRRKYLRIAVENTGRAVAQECVAKLRILKNISDDLENPETEQKILQWSTEKNIRENIGVGANSLLNIVFSQDLKYSNKFAFVGTRMSLNGPDLPRIEDAFNDGDFDFEVVIKAIDGTSIRGVYRLKVTKNWLELTMKSTK